MIIPKHYKSIIKGGIGTVFSAFLGMVLLKVLAVHEGKAGVGVFGLYKQFFQLVSTFILCGGGISLIQFVASKFDDQYVYTKTTAYFLTITLLFSSLSFLFSSQLSTLIFDSQQFIHLFEFSFLIFMLAIATFYWRAFFSGKKWVGLSAGLQVLPVLFMLLTYLVFKNHPFEKSIVYLYLAPYTLTGLIAWYLQKKKLGLNLKLISFSRSKAFEKTSLATLSTGILSFGSILVVKAMSAHHLGLESTGVLEAVWTLCWYVPLIFTPALTSYYLPRLSADIDKKEPHFINKMFFAIVGGAFIPFCLLITLQGFIIPLLYGEAFLTKEPLLEFFVLAEMLRTANLFFGHTLIAYFHKRFYLVNDFLSHLIFMSICYIGLRLNSRLIIIGYGYLLFQLMTLMLNLFYIRQRKVFGLRNQVLFLLGLVAVLVVLAFAF